MNRNAFISLLLIMPLLFLTCGKDSKNPTGPTSSDVKTKLKPETKIVENENFITGETVSENSVTYTFTGKSPDIETGDVLVGNKENWYLRTVKQVTIQDNIATVETEQARLTDAIERAKVDTVLKLESPSAEKIIYAEKGVSLVEGKIDLSGVVLYSGSIKGVQANITITDGQISFKPDMDIGIQIDRGIKEFHLIPRGELVFDCDVSATVDGSLNDIRETTLISMAYMNWVYVPGTFIAIPVITTLTFKAGYEILSDYHGSISTGVASSFQVGVGAKYLQGDWSPIFETSFVHQVHETKWSQNGKCYIRCYVIPEIKTTIASFVGPYINIEPYLTFDGSIGGQYAWYWELSGGINANFGFNVNFLGYDIADYSKELVANEKLLDSKYLEKQNTSLIQGKILENGNGLSDVLVQIIGESINKTVTTSNDGKYVFSEIPDGTYTLTPTMNGYEFTPLSVTVIISGTDKTIENITATNFEGSHTISDIAFVGIPAGTYLMGDNNGVGWSDEHPVHNVTISGFEMSVYEITQDQYQSVIGSNPSYFKSGDNNPVEQVSWFDAINFCNALSLKVGLDKCYDETTGTCDFSKNGFRLPTEAEWEYACRAEYTTNYYTGNNISSDGNTSTDLDIAGWYHFNWGKTDNMHIVGQKTPNIWGLYDMHGNVWEWCNDWYSNVYYSSSPSVDPYGPSNGSYRVLRGGGWGISAYGCRSAYRNCYTPSVRYSYVGFRVVHRVQ